ncbi:MAG: flagellar basal body rod protein FlgC [Betaproteobacteria bacterium]|jgi:flagellar basal-body rod protein FlgC|nr:flagellar basal body rod protein FlgC [Betaproteobacteria bacterium]NBU43512.1 flagellar basal body rod protein FlgC [Betaproteobacteria bacterium]NDF64838.1 flagellar basal body rod protein FlgC [Betaproteobacteria bacterium]
MRSLDSVFGIAGTALNAQMVRMNTTASNLANATTVAGSEKDAFRAKRPVFKALLEEEMTHAGAPYLGGVKVDMVADDPTPIRSLHDPGNPMADANGYVYLSNVNEMQEMVEMMSASRSYQNNVEVVNTAKQLMMRTLDITKA